MSFVRVSLQAATELRDHIRAREPFKLQMLARWMRDTGGPLEQMDASFESLVPLWGWFVGQLEADLPTVCAGVRASITDPSWEDLERQRDFYAYYTARNLMDKAEADSALRSIETGRGRRTAYALEPLAHYLRLVVAREHPQAVWEVWTSGGDRVIDSRHHEVGIFLGERSMFFTGVLNRCAGDARRGKEGAREPGALLERVLNPYSGLLPRPVQERRASVLAPYLTADLGQAPAEAVVSPVWSWPYGWSDSTGRAVPRRGILVDEPAPAAVGEEMILARGPAEGLEDPSLLKPLDAEEVMRALWMAGFRLEDGSRPRVEDVLTDGAEFAHPAGQAQVSMLVHAGKLRAVHLEPAVLDEFEWSQMLGPFRRAAKKLRARFATAVDFEADS